LIRFVASMIFDVCIFYLFAILLNGMLYSMWCFASSQTVCISMSANDID